MYKGWIDCVSASIPFDRDAPSDSERRKEEKLAARRTLNVGRVPSRCGRSVIHLAQVIENMAKLDRETLANVGHLIFEGIYSHSCANDEWYLPKDQKNEERSSD